MSKTCFDFLKKSQSFFHSKMASGDNKTEEFMPKCWTHSSELLPLFCRDCDRVLCSDCVTGDHVGHKLCKVSEVAVYHKNAFEKILECDKTM